MAGQSDVTTATKESLNEPLENSFDASIVNEELGAQVEITRAFGQEAPKAVAEFSQNRIDDIKADPNLSIDEKLAEIEKWDEGGAYRVAAHTAIGALGTGNLEGSLTTGSVAAAAPKISEYESKLADALVSSGMSPEAANATSKGVTILTLAGIAANAGLDTSSTASAINVDSNNRWLHDSEVLNIFKHKKDIENFAKENGITYKQAYRAILAQAYRNTDDDFRNAHSPKPGTKESSLAQKAESFLRKHVLIASTASERKNHNLNRNSTKYKGLLSGVERKTPAYSQTNKNIQVLKGVGKITAEGTVKGVGNIPSDTANGVAQIFGGKYERSFPYDSPESEEVGTVAQNVTGVLTTATGIKVKVLRSSSGNTLELFTDSSGPLIPKARGVGPTDPSAIAKNAMSMPEIRSSSQSKVVANNPYIPKKAGGNFTIMDYLPESARVTKKGGEIVINGTASNKYLRGIPNEAELDKMGLKLKYNGPLKPEFNNFQFKTTDGKPLKQSTMKTIIFEKVK
ncbi:hypothetical protein [Psychrobacter phenylpyruvicus]|uniref:Uncharacterized protein n=1 Tax=Psychrobacter phenylpyruvicus TaxID=29432 RepID=A0A379LLH4_9GAMM|nr:hypothetical protein [Psychrobacter phenylpyruvicus]SUD90624.1 Uncharacterised protein [Psychrobacter phenylpyruvicus]